jgi:hypothetical protein
VCGGGVRRGRPQWPLPGQPAGSCCGAAPAGASFARLGWGTALVPQRPKPGPRRGGRAARGQAVLGGGRCGSCLSGTASSPPSALAFRVPKGLSNVCKRRGGAASGVAQSVLSTSVSAGIRRQVSPLLRAGWTSAKADWTGRAIRGLHLDLTDFTVLDFCLATLTATLSHPHPQPHPPPSFAPFLEGELVSLSFRRLPRVWWRLRWRSTAGKVTGEGCLRNNLPKWRKATAGTCPRAPGL